MRILVYHYAYNYNMEAFMIMLLEFIILLCVLSRDAAIMRALLPAY